MLVVSKSISESNPNYIYAEGPLALAVKYFFQPTVLISSVCFWLYFPDNSYIFPIAIITLQLILAILERTMPARPVWVVSWWTTILSTCLMFTLTAFTEFISVNLETGLQTILIFQKGSFFYDLWPRHWPILYQAALIFLIGEGLLYWVHRSQHRWSFLWRLSGHGVHHSFKKLGGVNYGLNHPFEAFFISLPSVIVGLLFSAGEAVTGATMIAVIQANIAHANLDLNSRFIGWILTTNKYHIHHHSVVLEESNSNYGCSTIIWDRIFGTFRDAMTIEVGTGPIEPTFLQKVLMPFHEPKTTTISPK